MSLYIPRRLRLHLSTRYIHLQPLRSQRSFYQTTPCRQSKSANLTAREREVTNDYKRRVAQLEAARGSLEECYPCLDDTQQASRSTIPEFRQTYKGLMRPNETKEQYRAGVAGT